MNICVENGVGGRRGRGHSECAREIGDAATSQGRTQKSLYVNDSLLVVVIILPDGWCIKRKASKGSHKRGSSVTVW